MNRYQARALTRLSKEIKALDIPETETALNEIEKVLEAHYEKMRQGDA